MRLRRTALADLFPDPKLSSLPDIQAREGFVRTVITLTHPTVVVGDAVSRVASEPQRVRSIRAGADPAGTITVKVSIDGRTLPMTAASSGGATVYPRFSPLFQAGSVITSTVTGTGGVPTGPVDVLVELDSFIITPISAASPVGRDRLFPSRRREAERTNQAAGLLRSDRSVERTVSSIGQPRVRNLKGELPITRREQLADRSIVHRFRPRRPR